MGVEKSGFSTEGRFEGVEKRFFSSLIQGVGALRECMSSIGHTFGTVEKSRFSTTPMSTLEEKRFFSLIRSKGGQR